MSTDTPTYALSDAPAQQQDHATFEFKRSHPDYTGGGYARWRSYEFDPELGRKKDVYVSVHRLAAVVWHLPDGTLGDDVRLAELDGMDVHHTQPDGQSGMPSANGEEWTELVDHGRHSEVTQAQRRAWAEDAKRARDENVTDFDDESGCVECGDDADAEVSGEEYCLECATDTARQTGETVRLL